MRTYELMGFNSIQSLIADENAREIMFTLPFKAQQELSPEQISLANILISYLRADKELIVPFESFCAVRDGNPTSLQREEWENYKHKANALVARYQAQLRGMLSEADIEFYVPSNHFLC